MKNIFIFNIGQISEQLSRNIEFLTKKGYVVNLGPSEEDHKFLLDNYDYYKEAINLKIWSFASDVWRSYILSKNEGLYLDTTLLIGNDFDSFYNKVSQFDSWMPKTRDLMVNGPIMFSKKAMIQKDVLEFFKKFKLGDDIREFPIGPQVLSIVCLNNGLLKKFIWEEHVMNYKGQVMGFGTTLDIRNKNTIWKYGSGSWFKGRFLAAKKARKGWDNFENTYLSKSYKYMQFSKWKGVEKYLDDKSIINQKLSFEDKSKVKISFIAPAFKVDNYLEDFFESFKKLTIDYEIILVNDDPNISLDKWASNKIKVVNNKVNVGQGESRNIGLKYISSDSTHFSFIDPDDRIGSIEFEDNISRDVIIDYTHNVWYKNKLVGPKTNGEKGPQGVAKTIWGVIFPITLKDDKDILCRDGEINDYPIKMRLSKRYYIHKSDALMIDYRMRKSSTTRTTFSRKRALQQVYSYFSLEKDGFLTTEQAKNKAYEELLIRKKSFTNDEFTKLKKELKPGASKWFGFTGTMSRVTHTIQIIKFFTDLFSLGKPFD